MKISATIEKNGISLDFTAPEIDLSGAEFLEVSNVKVETTVDGYVVTGEFSVEPDWASIFSEAGDGYVSLYWDEDLKAFVSDELLTEDDLIISFDGGEWDDEGEPIISWSTQLYMDTLELQYQHYRDEKASYGKSSEGDLSYRDPATDTYVSVNPETGYYSYSDGKINRYKNEDETFYHDVENDISLSITEDYSYYTASTGENESLYVEFMPNGKLSYYGVSTYGADGSELSYSYNRYGQLNGVNYWTADYESYYYWRNGVWYNGDTDEVADLDIEVSTAAGPYAEPYVIKAPSATLDGADTENGTIREGYLTTADGERTEGYIYDDGIVNAFYTTDGKLYHYSYSNFDGSKFVRYGAAGDLLYADIYLEDGTNYWYWEGVWKTVDPVTGETVTLDGQPAGVDLSDMPDLLAAPVASAKPEHIWFGKNTLGLAAVSMKDLGISSDWHNVAPVDLTTDGTTVFTLVGADAWILGQAYVTVAEGNVTVTYDILDGHGYMKSEKMNWFLTKANLTEENLKADSNYAFGEPVSIAEDLDGAETAILFIDSKITFRQPYFDAYNYSTRYYRSRENWKEYREGLIEMIK